MIPLILMLAAAGGAGFILLSQRQAPAAREAAFAVVYVNQDGSVRELSPEERAYVSADFAGGDGDRPYVKLSYESRDGWGSLSGFLERRRLPTGTVVAPVHPDYDARMKAEPFDILDSFRAGGDEVVTHADGTVTSRPDPAISPKERFERSRAFQLEDQRRREALAKA